MGNDATSVGGFLPTPDSREDGDPFENVLKRNVVGQLAHRFDRGFIVRHVETSFAHSALALIVTRSGSTQCLWSAL